jgi:hypothetical protein
MAWSATGSIMPGKKRLGNERRGSQGGRQLFSTWSRSEECEGNSSLALGGTRGNDKVDKQRGRHGHAEDKTEYHG